MNGALTWGRQTGGGWEGVFSQCCNCLASELMSEGNTRALTRAIYLINSLEN